MESKHEIFAVITVELIPQKYYLQKVTHTNLRFVIIFTCSWVPCQQKLMAYVIRLNTAFYIHFFMANVFYQGKGEGYLIIQVAHCSKRVT